MTDGLEFRDVTKVAGFMTVSAELLADAEAGRPAVLRVDRPLTPRQVRRLKRRWSRRGRRPGFVHNVIAHPLLVLCPRLGEWLHGRTNP